MHIGVDFDDVLFPYHHHLKLRLKKRYGVDLLDRHITTFFYELLPEFQRRGIDRDAIWKEVQAAWTEAGSHDAADLLDGDAARVLADLHRRHKVTIVTLRSPDARPRVQRFLKRHKIPYHQLWMGRADKSGFDVLVDDFPQHAIENAASGGHSLLFTIDENSTFDESRHPRILRVHSWNEVEERVIGLERRRRSRG